MFYIILYIFIIYKIKMHEISTSLSEHTSMKYGEYRRFEFGMIKTHHRSQKLTFLTWATYETLKNVHYVKFFFFKKCFLKFSEFHFSGSILKQHRRFKKPLNIDFRFCGEFLNLLMHFCGLNHAINPKIPLQS